MPKENFKRPVVCEMLAETIAGHPMAMQMRFLQTLSDIGAENNTTIVFPMPIELLNAVVKDSSHNKKSKRAKPRSETLAAVPQGDDPLPTTETGRVPK
jgi:hypothetical protein